MSILIVGNIQANTSVANSFTPITATGGTESQFGINGTQYKVHVFTSSGNFVVSSAGTSGTIDYLIVAGGGGGGMDMGGGGGGGGVLQGSRTVAATTYPIVVGAGGWGAPAPGTPAYPGGPIQVGLHPFTVPATNGNNSTAFGLTAVGGGAGGSSYWNYTPGPAGNTGGSGGGTSGYANGGGTLSGGAGTAGQGFAGGQGGGQYYSGGGGGAGGTGTNSTLRANGGTGVYSDILGVGYYWGGGGGGSGYSTQGGDGGQGGGGGGAVGTTYGGVGYNNGNAGGGGSINSQTNKPGGNAGVNTGGGGGGGSHYNATNSGGNGGSGIVIIRYPLTAQEQTISVTNGGVISQPGTVLQVQYVRTDSRTTYTSLGTGYGTPIGALALTITPKEATSLLICRWMINGEVHYDTIWRIFQNDQIITEPGYQGFNRNQGTAEWSGFSVSRYDRNDQNSTPQNYFIQYMIPAFSRQIRTYTPAIRTADSSTTYTFALNRTLGSTGADTLEVMVSSGYVMEIAQ